MREEFVTDYPGAEHERHLPLVPSGLATLSQFYLRVHLTFLSSFFCMCTSAV